MLNTPHGRQQWLSDVCIERVLPGRLPPRPRKIEGENGETVLQGEDAETVLEPVDAREEGKGVKVLLPPVVGGGGGGG